MGAFGASLLLACGIAFTEAVYHSDFTAFVENSPEFYYVFSLMTGLLTDIMPILLIYKLHNQSFGAAVVAVAEEPARLSLISEP